MKWKLCARSHAGATGWLAGLSMAGGLTACAFEAPTVGEVLSTEDGITVSEAVFETRANHTDLVPVHVIFPSDETGHALPAQSSRPAMVFVQGGLVPPERYFWLAERLARKGYVIALPEFANDLALLTEENGHAARDLLKSPPAGSVLDGQVDPAKIAVGGHSLGGVTAVDLALDGGYAGLLIYASIPADYAIPELPGLGIPSLSLAGSADCGATQADFRAGAETLPAPSVLAMMEGVTHYQFTDSQAEDDENGCVPGVSIERAHDLIEAVTVDFLTAAFSATPGTGAEEMAALDGVEVTAR